MRPAEVWGCWTKPSSSSRARMLRTVADDTPSPAAVTSNADATGSPDVMYSRTSAASTRFDLSAASCVIYRWQSQWRTAKHYTTDQASTSRRSQPGARCQFMSRAAGFRGDLDPVDAYRRELVDE